MIYDITLTKVIICALISFFLGYAAGYLSRHFGLMIHEHFKDEEEDGG
jgi:hypothetical protein